MNVDPTFTALRRRLLTVDPASLRLQRTPGNVFALITEMGMEEGVATLVAIADGTVSIYFSGGGAVVGMGSHLGPRRAAEALLDEAPSHLSSAAAADGFPLPSADRVRFWFLTFEGARGAEAGEAELEKHHPLARLYALAQELLTEVRVISDAVERG